MGPPVDPWWWIGSTAGVDYIGCLFSMTAAFVASFNYRCISILVFSKLKMSSNFKLPPKFFSKCRPMKLLLEKRVDSVRYPVATPDLG